MEPVRPARIRTGIMLLAVLGIGAAAYGIYDCVRLRDARQQFDVACAGWENSRATAENVVLTSAMLMSVEAASPWISERAAREDHQARLNELLKDLESLPTEENSDEVARQIEIVRRAIEQTGIENAH